MAKLPTYEEMGKKIAEEALDGYIYKGKTLREWVDILAQTRWIPVSEKLPEKDGYYLTTFVSFGSILLVDVISFAKNLKNVDHYDFDKAEPGWYNYDSEYGYYKVNSVIAWMPLPEPYKAGDTNA